MPLRYPNGVSTASKTEPFGEFILPDPSTVHFYREDFDYFNINDWDVEEIGTPFPPVFELTSGDGGILIGANSSGASDEWTLLLDNRIMSFETGKKIWFDCKFQINETINSVMEIGLRSAFPASAPVNALRFLKNNGTDTIRVDIRSGAASVFFDLDQTISPNTDIRLSYFYDGVDKYFIFVDGVQVNSNVGAPLPLTVLSPGFGISNVGVDTFMRVDYVIAAKER